MRKWFSVSNVGLLSIEFVLVDCAGKIKMSAKPPVVIPLVNAQERLPFSHPMMWKKLKESAQKDLMRVHLVRPTVHLYRDLDLVKCYSLEKKPPRKKRGRPRKNVLSVIKTSGKKRVPSSKRRKGNGGAGSAGAAESSVSHLPEPNGSDVQDGGGQSQEIFIKVIPTAANGVSIEAKNVSNDGGHSASDAASEVDCVRADETIDMISDPRVSTVDTPSVPDVEKTKLTYVAPALDVSPFIDLLEARNAFSGLTAICDVIPDEKVQVVEVEVRQPPAPMVNCDAANEDLGDSNDAQNVVLPGFCQNGNFLPQNDVITFEVEENGVIVQNFEVPVTFGTPPSGAVVMQSNGSDFPFVSIDTSPKASVLSSPLKTSNSNVNFEVNESQVHRGPNEEGSADCSKTASHVETSPILECVKPVAKFIPFFSKKSGSSFIKRKKQKSSIVEERGHGV